MWLPASSGNGTGCFSSGGYLLNVEITLNWLGSGKTEFSSCHPIALQSFHWDSIHLLQHLHAKLLLCGWCIFLKPTLPGTGLMPYNYEIHLIINYQTSYVVYGAFPAISSFYKYWHTILSLQSRQGKSNPMWILSENRKT